MESTAIKLLRKIFSDIETIKSKTPLTRVDKIAGFDFVYTNGIDVRVDIETIKQIQKLLSAVNSNESNPSSV